LLKLKSTATKDRLFVEKMRLHASLATLFLLNSSLAGARAAVNLGFSLDKLLHKHRSSVEEPEERKGSGSSDFRDAIEPGGTWLQAGRVAGFDYTVSGYSFYRGGGACRR